MPKKTFWMLDLNQQIYHGRSSIWLWGIDHDNKRVLIVDTHFRPYFYLLPKPRQEIEKIKEQLVESKPHPTIESVVIEKKKLLDSEESFLKVYCTDPFSIEKAARQTMKKLDLASSFEADLRQATKYQNEYGIQPCKWYTVEVVQELENPSQYSVDLAGVTHTPPLHAKIDDPPPKLCLFAFRTLTANRSGHPSPSRDPVLAITWTTNNDASGILQLGIGQDRRTLEQFGELVRKENPDIILTFEGNTVDWPYLVKRSEIAGVKLNVGRQEGLPHQGLYGHYSITGRGNVDLADFARYLADIKDKTLQNLTTYFGVDSPVVEKDPANLFDDWSNVARRKILLDDLAQETQNLISIGNHAVDYVTQVSALSGLPPDQAIAAAVGFRVDNFLMMEAHSVDQVIPSREEQYAATYKGGLVIQPQTGLYKDVALLDFSSMYPSLMVKHNISPDTLLRNGDDDNVFVVPEVHHRFRKAPPGFYAVALTKLLQDRKTTKSELKFINSQDPKYRLLRARDLAIKVTTNATYGYAGWAGARWYSREVAESAAALGRDAINHAISTAKNLGLNVLYSDTDSLFVNYDRPLVEKFLDMIDKNLGLDIALSDVYERMLFTEAKKKYAGMRRDGQIDVVGLEAIRGDWSTIARDAQAKVLRIILEEANPEKAVDYVSKLARDLKATETPLSSYVIWKTISKPVNRYEVNAPHVEAARKMVKDGWPVSVGDRVGFVITRKPGKLYQKAEPYYKASLDQVDFDYYVQSQIVPATARILEVFGISQEQLLTGRNPQKLL